MKKFFLIVPLAVLFSAALVGCGDRESGGEPNRPPQSLNPETGSNSQSPGTKDAASDNAISPKPGERSKTTPE